MKKESGALPADLRRENQRKVMKYLLRKGEATISEIAENIDISRLTAKKCVDYYIEKEIVVSHGKGVSTEIGGKKPLLYGLCDDKLIVSILMHRDEVIVGITNMSNDILYNWSSGRTEINSLDGFWDIVREIFACNMTDDLRDKILICCVVVPIIADQEHKITGMSPFPKWPQSDIGRVLTEPVPDLFPNIELYDVVSDCCGAGASLLKEFEYLEKAPVVVTFYIHQGVGGALYQYGTSGSKFGRAWGHIVVREDDEELCHCGCHGCLEKVISRSRMRKHLLADELYESSILSEKPIEEIGYSDLFAASQQGDELARKEVIYCARQFSIVIRNIILMVEPSWIYIQGDFGQADDLFKNEVLKQIAYFVTIGCRYDKLILYDQCNIISREISGAAYIMMLEYIEGLNSKS